MPMPRPRAVMRKIREVLRLTLGEVRREVWNDARQAGEHIHARQFKRTRYAVWKNQENLTESRRGSWPGWNRSTVRSSVPTS